MKKYLLEAAQLARGFMPHEEGMSLYEIALQVAPRSAILEVGSYCGKSTIYLGAAARQTGSTVFTIDHHRGSEEMQRGWAHHDSELVDRDSGLMDSLPELRRNLEKTSLNDVVVPIIGDSLVVARHWAGDISMLFIDGGHGPVPAHSDYESWASKVTRGGFMAIHDVFPNPADGGRPPYEIYCRALDEGLFEQHSSLGSLQVLRRL